MALLYYWRPDNYRRDLDFGAGYHLNQGSSTAHLNTVQLSKTTESTKVVFGWGI
jgi:hypothetical protein